MSALKAPIAAWASRYCRSNVVCFRAASVICGSLGATLVRAIVFAVLGVVVGVRLLLCEIG